MKGNTMYFRNFILALKIHGSITWVPALFCVWRTSPGSRESYTKAEFWILFFMGWSILTFTFSVMNVLGDWIADRY